MTGSSRQGENDFDPMDNAVISEEKKFIYIKIGKVCSTSIHHLLKDETKLIIKKENPGAFDSWLERYNRNEYFVFGFVRNPWDRMVSIWNYHNAYLPEFKRFIRSDFIFNKNGSQKVSIFNHSRQMIEYFFTDLDFTGKYENLEGDWKYVAGKLGLSDTLPYENKTKDKKDIHYSAYYDDSDVEVIRKRYKDDIERFEYEFEMV